MSDRTCSVEGCDKPPRSPGSAWCPMHYHRWYRHGSVEKVAPTREVGASLGRRYRMLTLPDHPMTMPCGRAYEHRVVLYDLIGPGPHACHWCETAVDWLPKGDPRELQPDHLNDDGLDNRPENLVPACRPCNVTRGQQKASDRLRSAGWWSHHDTVAVTSGRKPRIERATQV